MNSSWKKWLENRADKIMYIMRGLSGSGKSTLAKKLGDGGVVYSTDDFFMQDGKYNFDPTRLAEFHEANLKRAIESMKQGVSPIVIDNTHTQAWEAKPYVEAGTKYGYEIEFKQPDTNWAFDAEELAKRNSHGVPLNVIQNMLNRWEPDMNVDSVLKSQRPEYKRPL